MRTNLRDLGFQHVTDIDTIRATVKPNEKRNRGKRSKTVSMLVTT
jgi:hypothetical protein